PNAFTNIVYLIHEYEGSYPCTPNPFGHPLFIIIIFGGKKITVTKMHGETLAPGTSEQEEARGGVYDSPNAVLPDCATPCRMSRPCNGSTTMLFSDVTKARYWLDCLAACTTRRTSASVLTGVPFTVDKISPASTNKKMKQHVPHNNEKPVNICLVDKRP